MGVGGTAARRRRLRRIRHAKVALLAALPVVAAVWVFALPPAGDPHEGIPAYARHNARIAEAYHFAASGDGWILQWMACYCGCGTHSGHASNLDCFVERDGSGFDEHGANCDVCVDIALSAKAMYARGNPLPAIRDAIDARYPNYEGTATPTPP